MPWSFLIVLLFLCFLCLLWPFPAIVPLPHFANPSIIEEKVGRLVFMPAPCEDHDMVNLLVKNIPEDLHERLRRHARENHCTLSASVLAALERELARWEWRKHLARRPKTSLGVPAAALLLEERSHRDPEIG